LLVVSRVEGAARQAGAAVVTAATRELVVAECGRGGVSLVIVDLSLPSLDVASLVESIRGAGGPAKSIVAFGPHVHESLLAAAREAGCDQVISRGQFFAQVDAILRVATMGDAAADP
jgi:DNA-binding NarL/FixJ family response regulator